MGKGTGWLVILKPTPELITSGCEKRTQIVYHADISLTLALLDASPGKIIIESGTGSGSVSSSLARAVGPSGRLHTFEFYSERQKKAEEDFRRYGFSGIISSYHRNVCDEGYPAELKAVVDGAFLDLPNPWVAIPHADVCLKAGGRLVNFSPCIEQVQRACTELRRLGYQEIRTFESLSKAWGIREADDAEHEEEKDCLFSQKSCKGKGKMKGKGKGGQKRKLEQVGVDPVDDQKTDLVKDHSGQEAAIDGKRRHQGESTRPQEWLSYQLPMRGHTGYLTVALKPPADEEDQEE